MSQWVLLRGLMREGRHWGDFPITLQEALPEATVSLLDLPGNGQLHAMQSPKRVEQMAEFCHSEMRARGIAPPYHLLALSLGAMVATAWAERFPDEIAGCVLINTSLRPFSPFYRRLRPRNYRDLLAIVLAGNDATLKEHLIYQLTSSLPPDAERIEKWVRFRRDCPVSNRNALRQLVAAIRYRAPIDRPLKSLLILSSAKDGLVESTCSHTLARHWNVPLCVHPMAGHDLPLDDGPWVARQVRDWLRSSEQHVSL
ncbi:alpha/beta hydrolase [soil metagenome]